MSYYKFGPNDIFNNVIKTHPQCKFFIYNGNVFYNDRPGRDGEQGSSINHVPVGYLNLYEINVDRASGQLVYPFISKNSTSAVPRTISTKNYNASFSYGDQLDGSYPLSASITKTLIDGNVSRNRIKALKNVLNFIKRIVNYQLHQEQVTVHI